MSGLLRKSKTKIGLFSFLISSVSGLLERMTTRILIAGIIGGVVMFIWSFIAHEFLPIGELGIKVMPNEDVVTSTLFTNLRDPGFYIFPSGGLTPSATREQKEAARKKAEEQMASGAAGVLIYCPGRIFNFPKRLGIEFATEVLESILAVFLLAQTQISGFGGKVGFILVAGILASITTNVPYVNWYGFPKDYALGYMTTQIVGFLLVGIVAALILRQRTTQTA
jgi:hypothetical protein